MALIRLLLFTALLGVRPSAVIRVKDDEHVARKELRDMQRFELLIGEIGILIQRQLAQIDALELAALFLHVLLTGFEILIVLVDSGFDHGELFHLGKILAAALHRANFVQNFLNRAIEMRQHIDADEGNEQQPQHVDDDKRHEQRCADNAARARRA